MPPPYPKPRQPPQSHRTRHRATEGDRQGRHPRRTGRAGERGRERDRRHGWSVGQGEPGREPERMRRGDLGTGHRWSGADCTADGQSHAERPRQAQHPQRVTARQQTQTGRREPQNAVSGAFRARYRYIILYPYMNHTARIIENRGFHSPAEKSLKKIEKGG